MLTNYTVTAANGDQTTIYADTVYTYADTVYTYVDLIPQMQDIVGANFATYPVGTGTNQYAPASFTTDYETWIKTEWNTGNWWYRRQNELWEADQIKFNNPFDDEYRIDTEADKDNEDFDTTEINKYLETLREEVVATKD